MKHLEIQNDLSFIKYELTRRLSIAIFITIPLYFFPPAFKLTGMDWGRWNLLQEVILQFPLYYIILGKLVRSFYKVLTYQCDQCQQSFFRKGETVLLETNTCLHCGTPLEDIEDYRQYRHYG